MEKEMKKEAELRIHLIKVDHSVIERREPLAMLPQIFPMCLASAIRPSPGLDSSLLTLTAHFLLHCEPSSTGCFPLSTRRVDLEGSTEVLGSSLVPRLWLRVGISEPTMSSKRFITATGVETAEENEQEIRGCPPNGAQGPRGTLDVERRGRLLKK